MNKYSYRSQNSPYKGSGSLTREQFFFFEMRTTAKLMISDLSDEQIIEQIVNENLFQYPTERTIKKAASACVNRLRSLNDDILVKAIAEGDSQTAKQICLYAMMLYYRIIWDFMITVIGEKYRQQDFTFSRRDISVFFMRLQEQDDTVASWSEATIKKIESEINKILIENEYIHDRKATRLNPVMICRILESSIRESGKEMALPAFNCLA